MHGQAHARAHTHKYWHTHLYLGQGQWGHYTHDFLIEGKMCLQKKILCVHLWVLLPVQGRLWENRSLLSFWTAQTDSSGQNSKLYTVWIWKREDKKETFSTKTRKKQFKQFSTGHVHEIFRMHLRTSKNKQIYIKGRWVKYIFSCKQAHEENQYHFSPDNYCLTVSVLHLCFNFSLSVQHCLKRIATLCVWSLINLFLSYKSRLIKSSHKYTAQPEVFCMTRNSEIL